MVIVIQGCILRTINFLVYVSRTHTESSRYKMLEMPAVEWLKQYLLEICINGTVVLPNINLFDSILKFKADKFNGLESYIFVSYLECGGYPRPHNLILQVY